MTGESRQSEIDRMDPFWIKTIFWTVIGVAAIVLVIAATRGPPRPLDCTSAAVKDTVIDIIKENTRWGKGDSDFDLDHVRNTGADDPAAPSVECAATVWVNYRGTPFHSADLTYTIERQPGGKGTVRITNGLAALNKFP